MSTDAIAVLDELRSVSSPGEPRPAASSEGRDGASRVAEPVSRPYSGAASSQTPRIPGTLAELARLWDDGDLGRAADPTDALYAELARVERLPASPEREAEVQRLLKELIERERAEAERMSDHFRAWMADDARTLDAALRRADELLVRHGRPSSGH